MFSFVGDTVLDPFCGTATTMVAALKTRRNSLGVEPDTEYCRMAASRLMSVWPETSDFLKGTALMDLFLTFHFW
jgi:site-specific DNA-methyltransferase (adenine-specific)